MNNTLENSAVKDEDFSRLVNPNLKTSHNLTMELSELVLSAFLTISFHLYLGLLIVQIATAEHLIGTSR